MGGLTYFWEQGDAITRGVAALLLLMSVSAWVVIFWKGWLLRRVQVEQPAPSRLLRPVARRSWARVRSARPAAPERWAAPWDRARGSGTGSR